MYGARNHGDLAMMSYLQTVRLADNEITPSRISRPSLRISGQELIVTYAEEPHQLRRLLRVGSVTQVDDMYSVVGLARRLSH